MKLFRFFTILFLLVSTMVFSQEKIKHVVVSGESVYSIAKKYNVSEADIFEENPKAKGILALNTVLYIPKKSAKSTKDSKKQNSSGASHKVVSGESLYSIAKKYDTSVDKMREVNPQLISDNLQLGELLSLPKGIKKQEEEQLSKTEKKKIAKLQKKLQKHTVASGESFYVIARKYNVSVDELKSVNPQIENNKLDVKDIIFIPGTENIAEEKESVVESKKTDISESKKDNLANQNAVVHEVVSKETKYGISKRYGISIAQLEKLNPHIANGLEIGQRLVVKEGITPIESQVEVVQTESKKEEEVRESVSNSNDETSSLSLSADAAEKADFLIAKASENMGVRYRSGGTDRSGFDCSGLMFVTYKNIDITLPRSSSDMAANAGVEVSKSQAQKGDLIFFTTRGRAIGHVGMVTEVLDDEIKFIHSSTSSGVIISSTKEAYYAKRFVQINRVLN
ncbi:LysM peptidoglycan-binding domain-containing protein [Flavobacterium sp.]|uniref:LysM peptidoglycan-binding domain-containing protein n=1 Tax=Flavobacterium sp. TaxID=239 RepID=UPI0028BE8536|nr:LysM peptidoglycan-binding domain-containing protein [Flavobacterium sp.]